MLLSHINAVYIPFCFRVDQKIISNICRQFGARDHTGVGRSALLPIMGKKTVVKKSVKTIKDNLPFKVDDVCSDSTSFPRNMKAKQRASILAGLKHLGAPIAA